MYIIYAVQQRCLGLTMLGVESFRTDKFSWVNFFDNSLDLQKSSELQYFSPIKLLLILMECLSPKIVQSPLVGT